MSVFRRTWERADGSEGKAFLIKTVVHRPDGTVVRLKRHAHGRSKRSALKEEQALIAAAINGTLDRREGIPTVQEAVEAFLKAKDGEVRASTFGWYKDLLERVVVAELGEHQIDEVRGSVVQEFRKALEARGQNIGTIRGTVRALRALVLWAWAEWKLPKEDEPEIKVPTDDRKKKPPRYLTLAQVEDLVAASRVESAEWEAFVLLGVKTGCRVSELLAVRREALDLDGPNPKLHVLAGMVDRVEKAPKSGEERTIPLSEQTAERLRRFLKVRAGRPGDRLFPWETKDAVTSALRRFAARAGLPLPLGPHLAFRHTFASNLALQNVSLQKIQALLGHSTIAQTEIYARLRPGDVDAEVVAMLDAPVKRKAARR